MGWYNLFIAHLRPPLTGSWSKIEFLEAPECRKCLPLRPVLNGIFPKVAPQVSSGEERHKGKIITAFKNA